MPVIKGDWKELGASGVQAATKHVSTTQTGVESRYMCYDVPSWDPDLRPRQGSLYGVHWRQRCWCSVLSRIRDCKAAISHSISPLHSIVTQQLSVVKSVTIKRLRSIGLHQSLARQARRTRNASSFALKSQRCYTSSAAPRLTSQPGHCALNVRPELEIRSCRMECSHTPC